MKTFKESLLIRMEERGFSLLEISKNTGVSYEQLKKLKQGKSRTTNVEDAIKVASFFGMDVNNFIGLQEGSAQHRLMSIVSNLSPEALETLTSVATAQLAFQEIESEKSQTNE